MHTKTLAITTLTFLLALPAFSIVGNVETSSATADTLSYVDALSGRLWLHFSGLDPVQGPAVGGPSPSASVLAPPPQAPTGIVSGFERNIRVTSDRAGLAFLPFQAEPTIAANPLDPLNLVVGAIDFNSEFGEVVAYRSLDGGITWRGPSYLPHSPRLYSPFASDPVLAVTREGRFYYSYVSVGSANNDEVSDLVVSTSTDGGASWQATVARAGLRDFLNDKPWLTLSPSRTNPDQDTLYLTYTEFDFRLRPQISMQVKLLRSEDGGTSWSAPLPVSPRGTFPQVVQGSMPAVGPDGIVYVAYYDAGGAFLRGPARIMVARSLDGGQSFEPPREAASIPHELSFASSWFRWWGSMQPRIAISPNGAIYIIYAADPDGEGPDSADIFLVKSLDQGLSWGAPVRVSDDATQRAQFFPALAVGVDGRVHVIWGDRRLDPTETGYDIFYAVSSDGGVTFGRSERVTDITSTSRQGLTSFIGDYFHLAVTPLNVHAVWTDARRGSPTPTFFFDLNEDIFAARLGERPTPILSVRPPESQADASSIANITGANFPREAFVDLLYGEAKVTSLQTDTEGRFTATIVLPSVQTGLRNLTVAEPTTGMLLASASVDVLENPVIESIRADLDRARRELAESSANQSSAIGSLRNEVSQALTETGAAIEKTVAETGVALGARMAQTDQQLTMLTEEVGVLEGTVRVLTVVVFVTLGVAVVGVVGMLTRKRA